jgi:hypothetical protein
MGILLCNILASVNLILITKILINVRAKAIIYNFNNYKYLHKVTFYNTDLYFFVLLNFDLIQMPPVHFLYSSIRSKAKLEVRLQHTNKASINTTNYIWTAKTLIEVTKDFWVKQRKVKSKGNVDISNEQTRVNNLCNALHNFIINCFNLTTPDAITKDWLQSQINHYYNPQCGH